MAHPASKPGKFFYILTYPIYFSSYLVNSSSLSLCPGFTPRGSSQGDYDASLQSRGFQQRSTGSQHRERQHREGQHHQRNRFFNSHSAGLVSQPRMEYYPSNHYTHYDQLSPVYPPTQHNAASLRSRQSTDEVLSARAGRGYDWSPDYQLSGNSEHHRRQDYGSQGYQGYAPPGVSYYNPLPARLPAQFINSTFYGSDYPALGAFPGNYLFHPQMYPASSGGYYPPSFDQPPRPTVKRLYENVEKKMKKVPTKTRISQLHLDIRLVSYNVLSDHLQSCHPELYVDCDPNDLSFKNRKHRIIKSILYHDPNVRVFLSSIRVFPL